VKYPKELRPFKTEYEHLAWLYGGLSNAYNIIAQYEADERLREAERIEEIFTAKREKKSDGSI
jgi:hypothetical protein